jgi:YD repeat-containing protein
LRKVLIVLAACSTVLLMVVVGGPLSSGALFLLVPTFERPRPHGLPESYTPVHKGHVDLSSGRYVRENEDLVVPGTPALVLRRTHYSGWRVPKAFGIGAMQAADWYVIGDGRSFQWAALVRPGQPEIRFQRTSPGSSLINAIYRHDSADAAWSSARLGWTGFNWALRHNGGALAQFRPCGPDAKSVCSIVSYRDEDGHLTNYRRDAAGRLQRIVAQPDRWIAFEYDNEDRVARASDSTGREVSYEYDARGRLARVKRGGAVTHRYTYTDRDEMATIVEPGTDITNEFDENGRCIRQVNRFADGSDPLIFDFSYRLDGANVIQTDSRRSDGTWVQYAFKDGFTIAEVWGSEGHEPATFAFNRDPDTHAVVSLSLTCPDRTGRQLRHTSLVKPGREDSVKQDLARTHCFSRATDPDTR